MIDKVGDKIISEMEFPCFGDVSYSKETTFIGKKYGQNLMRLNPPSLVKVEMARKWNINFLEFLIKKKMKR